MANTEYIAQRTPDGQVVFKPAAQVKQSGASKSSSTSANRTSSHPYMDAYRQSKPRIDVNYQKEVNAAKKNKTSYLAEQAKGRDAYLASEKKLYNAYLKKAAEDNTASINKTNSGYDASARQNYINYMRAQKQLPSQLNALGINGGATESSLIRMNSNYGTNVAANEVARQNALAELEAQYKQNLFDRDVAYRQALQAYDDAYNNRIASYNDTYNNRLAEIASSRREALNNAYLTAMQNDLTYRKEMREQSLANFKDSIMGRYNTVEQYDKLIERLRQSKNPDRATLIAYAKQARTALQKEQQEQSRSGGGYSGGGRSYGGGYSSGYGYGDTAVEEETTTAPRSILSDIADYALANPAKKEKPKRYGATR